MVQTKKAPSFPAGKDEAVVADFKCSAFVTELLTQLNLSTSGDSINSYGNSRHRMAKHRIMSDGRRTENLFAPLSDVPTGAA